MWLWQPAHNIRLYESDIGVSYLIGQVAAVNEAFGLLLRLMLNCDPFVLRPRSS